eukprot:m51a1_g12325 putative poly -specific ribonuclease parn (513) ;mRNA; r:445642-447749
MDVVVSNFVETFPAVVEAIRGASFVALDTELTGLAGSSGDLKRFLLDTPQQRYDRQRSSLYLVIQLGVACFRWDPEHSRHVAKVFNFWLFPRPLHDARIVEKRLPFQAGAFAFLSSVNFDFNRLVREGIPWLTKDQVAAERKRLAALREWKPVEIGPRDRPVVDKAIEKVGEWLEKTQEKTIAVPGSNSFVRLILFQQLSLKFPGCLVEVKAADPSKPNDKSVVVTRTTPEELAAARAERLAREEREIEAATGFSKVWEALAEAKKPIIGHNMQLDMLQLIWQFGVEGKELPDSVDEFKALVAKLSPSVFDTKYISSTCPDVAAHVPDNSLSRLAESLRSEYFARSEVVLDKVSERYEGSDAYHEAGFDAYVTGCVFASLCKNVCRAEGPVPEGQEPGPLSPAMQPYANKIFVMQALYPCFNISGPEELDVDKVFVLKDFPREWTNDNITELLSFAGEFKIKWLTGSSAAVVLEDAAKSAMVKERLANAPNVKVLTYNEFAESVVVPMDLAR